MTKCSISIFGSEKGGRSTGSFLSPSVRLGLKFPETGDLQYGAMIKRLDGQNIDIGDEQICEIRVFDEKTASQQLVAGAAFDIFEGGRKIGSGRVL